jgi:hypothetical protein
VVVVEVLALLGEFLLGCVQGVPSLFEFPLDSLGSGFKLVLSLIELSSSFFERGRGLFMGGACLIEGILTLVQPPLALFTFRETGLELLLDVGQFGLALLEGRLFASELLGALLDIAGPRRRTFLRHRGLAAHELATVLGPCVNLRLVLTETFFKGLDRAFQGRPHIVLRVGFTHDRVAHCFWTREVRGSPDKATDLRGTRPPQSSQRKNPPKSTFHQGSAGGPGITCHPPSAKYDAFAAIRYGTSISVDGRER